MMKSLSLDVDAQLLLSCQRDAITERSKIQHFVTMKEKSKTSWKL